MCERCDKMIEWLEKKQSENKPGIDFYRDPIIVGTDAFWAYRAAFIELHRLGVKVKSAEEGRLLEHEWVENSNWCRHCGISREAAKGKHGLERCKEARRTPVACDSATAEMITQFRGLFTGAAAENTYHHRLLSILERLHEDHICDKR